MLYGFDYIFGCFAVTVRGSVPGGMRFSPPIQTGPEAHPTSFTVGTGFLSRG
jgi:hypothetical protein